MLRPVTYGSPQLASFWNWVILLYRTWSFGLPCSFSFTFPYFDEALSVMRLPLPLRRYPCLHCQPPRSLPERKNAYENREVCDADIVSTVVSPAAAVPSNPYRSSFLCWANRKQYSHLLMTLSQKALKMERKSILQFSSIHSLVSSHLPNADSSL